MRLLRIGIAQINSTVGDFAGNLAKICDAVDRSRVLGVDLVTFPELAICGYPPEDLLFKTRFLEANREALRQVVERSTGIAVLIGFVDADGDIYNAAALVHDGSLVHVYHKMFLPNYGVFDENRYFQSGNKPAVYVINGVGVGVSICEDIWYETGPATAQAYAGAEVIVNISASPYHFTRGDFRERMLATRAADSEAVVVYNNLVGGQDELVFDGNSLVFDERGRLLARGRQFEEDFFAVDVDAEAVFRTRLHDPRWRVGARLAQGALQCVDKIAVSAIGGAGAKPPLPGHDIAALGMPGEVYQALALGTGDYIRKNGFKEVVVGLSGGVDSSLVAAIAADALGAEYVVGVRMPSPVTSELSMSGAETLARNLGIRLLTVPIDKPFEAYLDALKDTFRGAEHGIAEENIQARVRGTILMALSNKFGWIVLTTGNKSEYATGYTTLYGDMAGGFAVIKDVPKTLVYELCRYRNSKAGYDLIPKAIIERVPTAELRPDQKDTDVLPPYDQLDPVLVAYVEEDKSIEQIVGMGADRGVAEKSARMVDMSEYKRRQSPPGVKITARAFGRDRRLPITNRFRDR